MSALSFQRLVATIGSQSWWRNEVFLVINRQNSYITAPNDKIFTLPTRVLVELPSYKVVAFGHEARPVEYAGLKQAKVIYPADAFQIIDEEASTVLLRAMMQMILGNAYFLKPRVFLSQPTTTTPFMQELQQLVLLRAGAREVITVNPLLALAAGASLPLEESHGYAVGWWEDDVLLLGLIAFGHIQYERRFALPQLLAGAAHAQERDQSIAALADAWHQFMGQLPTEYRTVVSQEGLILSINDDDPQLPLQLAQTMGQPVQLVSRTLEIEGLRRLAGKRNDLE